MKIGGLLGKATRLLSPAAPETSAPQAKAQDPANFIVPRFYKWVQNPDTLKSFFEPDAKVALIVPIGGQSNAEGRNADGGDIISHTPRFPDHALMPEMGLHVRGERSTRLIPLVETERTGCRESPCSGMVNQFVSLVEEHFKYRPKVVTFNHGLTSRTYKELAPGTIKYERFKKTIRDIYLCAREEGYNAIVPAYVWIHGEAEKKTPQWLYETYIKQYHARISDDVRQITKQPNEPYLFLAQVAATRGMKPDNPRFYPKGPSLAAVGLHGQGRIRCVEGFYECPTTPDRVHLSCRGANILGQKIGRKLFDQLCGSGAECFRVISGRWVTRTTFRLVTTPPNGDVRILRGDAVSDTGNSHLGFEATAMNGQGTWSNLTRHITISIPESASPGLPRTEIDITFEPAKRPLRTWNLYWGMRGDPIAKAAIGETGSGDGPEIGGRTLIADTTDAPCLFDPGARRNSWLTAGQMLDIRPTF